MARRSLPWLLLLYGAASLVHFVHNAQFLTLYPNLPATWSSAEVYLAWCAVTVFGLLGYVLYRKGWLRVGLLVLGLYSLSGFAGLLHYTRAPFHQHTPMMNLTILAEAAAAALLLLAVCRIAAQSRQSPP